MQTKRIFWKIYPSHLIIALLALAALFTFSSAAMRRFYDKQAAKNLEVQAHFAGNQLGALFTQNNVGALQDQAESLGSQSSARITLIFPNGIVAGDSAKAPSAMGNHRDRPEVQEALIGRSGKSIRHSNTLKKQMMYVAVPVHDGDTVIGVVRCAMPLASIDEVLHNVQRRLIGSGALILLLTAGLSLWVSRRISRPLERIQEGAERFAQGDFSYRLQSDGSTEVGSLAETMNRMAAQLEERLQYLNRLENVRRDFVANVSHELKTPITSIKGFVETLRDGAISDPAEAERFLGIVAKHSDRLNAIIEDLLTLSRLEQDGAEGMKLEETQLSQLITVAMEVCSRRAAEKNITIQMDCPDRLSVRANPPLIEQALINLIGNAVKYSEDGNAVTVHAFTEAGQIILSVKDQGYGIEKKHLERLFERFYRVDKGRSRQEGGTGLGLAIVKHIAQAHGGRIEVQSTFGQGSTFSIFLPIS